MKDLEFNKLFASVLLFGITVLSVSNVVDALYHPREVTHYQYAVTSAETIESQTNKFDPAAVDMTTFFKDANIEEGKKLAKKCVACHTFEKGGHNKVGPNLWDILGKNKAHLGDAFKYSKALLEKGGTWDYNSMIHLLYKPAQYIKGTKMSFAGLSNPQDIANLIAYLRSLSDSPVPLPE